MAGPGRKQNTHNALGRRCSWQLSDEHLEAATQTLPSIRNMCAMFPSFRCGVLRTRDSNQISISPVFQTCRYVLVKEAKHCAFACDVSVLCRCRTAAVARGRPALMVPMQASPLCLILYEARRRLGALQSHTGECQGALGCAVASACCTVDDFIQCAARALFLPCMHARVPASHTAGHS